MNVKEAIHLAIILDGNRRWATQRGLPKITGHYHGSKNLRKLLPVMFSNGVNRVTVYALSSENLHERSAIELRNIFREIEKSGDDLDFFHNHEIRVRIFGNLKKFPTSTRKVLRRVVQVTKNYNKLNLNLALGYGGRDEIVRAAKKIMKAGKTFSEKTFSKFLDSSEQPDPDLLIRTSGTRRISNFLIWQLAYAELYFTEKMWPDFNESELRKAIDWFKKQRRNFGK